MNEWNENLTNNNTAIFSWGKEVDGKEVTEGVQLIHEKVVYSKKNLILLTSGWAGRSLIDKMIRRWNSWIEGRALENQL